MTKTSIPASLRRRVLADARQQCAYCHSLTAITGAKPVIDHIVPEAAGGPAEFENLCLACHACNEFKRAQIESQDPVTGEVVPLFHPRRQRWNDHFRWSLDGTEIVGITPIGRAVVEALNMNHTLIVEARRRWVAVGWHPPDEDL
jgi:hypothetical protein